MSALNTLTQAVEEFAGVVVGLTDADLERPWKWGDYEEGVRFIFFRVYETLRSLEARVASGRPVTHVQTILGQYQAAYRRMQAILLGVSDELAARLPAEGEWSLRTTLAHMLEAELVFWKVNADTVRSVRNGVYPPPRFDDKAWEQFVIEEPLISHLEDVTLSGLVRDYAVLNQRVRHTFADASESELETPVWYWETSPMPLHFRLHRFDSHLSQHTIQLEKTLVMLNLPLTESRRLLFQIYQALAGCEAALMGAAMDEDPAVNQAAEDVRNYLSQVNQVLFR